MTLDAVVQRFEARREGTGYKALCPAHEDSTASLSINLKGDKVLVKCFAGCDTETVLRAVGLTMKDLFVSSNGHGPKSTLGPPTAVYDYRDETDTLIYQSLRYSEPEKTFRQRRPDGAGGWVWNLEGTRRVLFGLPELADCTDVFVPEGEKDVLALRAIGLNATTNAGGAGKWRPEYAEQLVATGCLRVTILPDNEPPGQKHGQSVAASCAAAGLVVKVLNLPTLSVKGDVSDWLAAGGTRADLLALATTADVYMQESAPTVDVVADVPAEPALSVPYTFAHAFPPGHFVTTWIDHFSKQCDAALEYHEGAALVALAQATPSLTARISGSADGLRTNLYVLFMGRAGITRKSTAKDYAVETLRRALPKALLPEQMTQESFVESLTKCNNGAALWPIDEFTDMLSKMLNATFLAGMRGVLLEMYAHTSYAYRRVSKTVKAKKKGDDDPVVERVEDFFYIDNVTFGRAARKVGQYAGQKVGHLRGVYSTCSETTTTLNLTPPLFFQTA